MFYKIKYRYGWESFKDHYNVHYNSADEIIDWFERFQNGTLEGIECQEDIAEVHLDLILNGKTVTFKYLAGA